MGIWEGAKIPTDGFPYFLLRMREGVVNLEELPDLGLPDTEVVLVRLFFNPHTPCSLFGRLAKMYAYSGENIAYIREDA